ncbi:glycosyl hydrolase family 32, partial [Parapusillimonas sp. SGNA-6]|nr:glycosyl hydrolase family 32 [Parapusillimonas sp. SGNA-6]
ELSLAYSRDGFHWHRPDRRSFIEATRKKDWERGYLQSAGGVCLVVNDELWFYYGGFEGDEGGTKPRGQYQGSGTGLAKLRRDGFASLNATETGGTITTRLVTFKGHHLFVNVDCPAGELRAEILDEGGQVITPFSLANSVPLVVDKTCAAMTWDGGGDLAAIAGRKVSFRFHLKNGKFYAFWVSPDTSGASYGYVAAGGPGFTGAIDDKGTSV